MQLPASSSLLLELVLARCSGVYGIWARANERSIKLRLADGARAGARPGLRLLALMIICVTAACARPATPPQPLPASEDPLDPAERAALQAKTLRYDRAAVRHHGVVLDNSRVVTSLYYRVTSPAAVVHNDRVHLLFRAEGQGTGAGIFGLASSADGERFTVRRGRPVLRATEGEHGVQHPRLTRAGDRFALFFVATRQAVPEGASVPGRVAASVQLALSDDLVSWQRRGQLLVPARLKETGQVKAPVPVPAGAGGRRWIYYRREQGARRIRIGVASSRQLSGPYVEQPEPALRPRPGRWDAWGVEPGVAVLVPQGIFLIYAGWGGDGTTRSLLGWALFDQEDPARLIKRCGGPALDLPAGDLSGEGLVKFRGEWRLYFGALDRRVEMVTLDIDRLLGG